MAKREKGFAAWKILWNQVSRPVSTKNLHKYAKSVYNKSYGSGAAEELKISWLSTTAALY